MFEKQRVSPWDLLEGHKNPAPLSWSWFGAVRMERKPLWYEDTHRLLKYHTHSLLKSPAYFLDPPPLPPEDLDPPQEKPVSIQPFERPLSYQQSCLYLHVVVSRRQKFVVVITEQCLRRSSIIFFLNLNSLPV